MDSPNESQQSLIKKIFNKPIIVGRLVILLIAVFLIFTKRRDFCINVLSSGCNDIVKASNPPLIDVVAVGAGATAAAVLATVIEVPVTIAVGVGIVIWWLVNSLI